MKIKRIFVTGATGFIGSNLVRKLIEKDYDVYILNRKSSNLQLIEDIKDKLHIFEYEGNIRKFD